MKNNKIIYIVAIFLILMQNCFFLIDESTININGVFEYADIWLILYIICFGLFFIKYCILGDKKIYKNGVIIIALFILGIISAFQQKHLTGQNVSLGLIPQRYYLIILLSYFPIRHLLFREKIKIEKLFDFLLVMGIFSACLFIFQKIVIENFQFLNFTVRYRNGDARFYIDSTLIQIATLIATYKFCTEKKNKYLIAIGLFLFYLFWVTQGRLEIMSIIMSILFGILLTEKLSKKKVMTILVVIVAVIFFCSTTYVDNLISAIKASNIATTAQGNTMAIRIEGRSLYKEQLHESLRTLLFGCGYPNLSYGRAVEKAGFNNGIYLNDNGLYGFMYIYGIVGVVVIIILFIRLIKSAIYILKKNGNTLPLLYLILNICLCYNIIFWYWMPDGTFIFILMICCIEQLENKYKEQEMKGKKLLYE